MTTLQAEDHAGQSHSAAAGSSRQSMDPVEISALSQPTGRRSTSRRESSDTARSTSMTAAVLSRHSSLKRQSQNADIELDDRRRSILHIRVPSREENTPKVRSSNTEEDGSPVRLTPPSPTARNLATPASEDLPEDLGVGNAPVEDLTPPGDGKDPRTTSDDGDSVRHVAFVPPGPTKPNPQPYKPRSAYPIGPPPIGSAFGSPPMGQIGIHFPREMVRVERDYSGGELVQFSPLFPIELDGRITETQWLETINGMNEILISAHSSRRAAIYHVVSVVTLFLSTLVFETHYEKEMRRLRRYIDACNEQLYNPQGLNILWPQPSGFLFLEIEYY